MSFRYFLYISDSKVDMLLAQIDPGATRKRTTEMSLKLTVLEGRHSSEAAAGADRVDRLERVVRHLHDRAGLGSLDDPAPFVWGLLPMRWGPLVGRDGKSLVYFGGRADDTVVGLGGSRVHLLGPASAGEVADPAVPRSLLPSLLDGLRSPSLDDAVSEGDGEHADGAALAEVFRCTSALRGPASTVEFVAKRLLDGAGPEPGTTVLLASPLYVALVD